MRPPNFKLGWFVPHQIAALTHFHADVTAEDFMGVIHTGQELLGNVDKAFHVIIDNRFVNMPAPVSLSQMKGMVAYMNHPRLQWVVVVKPAALVLDTDGLPIEQMGETRLKNVSSLPEAINYLQATTSGIAWEKADATFFPDAEIIG
jgi:hypothetical protein